MLLTIARFDSNNTGEIDEQQRELKAWLRGSEGCTRTAIGLGLEVDEQGSV